MHLRSEEGGHEVTSNATNTVDGEDIERVVDVDQVLDLSGEIAHDGTNNTEYDGGPSWDVTGGWGNGDEAGDDTGAETNG